MSAYAKALRRAVTPGCTVIDIGAGPGLFALLACRYGAGKVIAIEPNASIRLLQQLAYDNGFSDRIEIVEGISTNYHPASRADVIVSDLRGGMPLYQSHIEVISDARERLLASGGVLIPARDHIRIGAVESAATYREYDEPWRSNSYEVDLSAGSRFAVNRQSKVALSGEVLLGPPQHVATIDYQSVIDPNLHSKVALPIDRAGCIHGLLLWFDAELATDATFSNAPGEPAQVYGQLFFALEQPLSVAAGDTLHAEITASLIEGSYVWSWNTALARGPSGAVSPCFRQSTFFATIFKSSDFAMQSEFSVPRASEKVEIDGLCLSLIDGEHSLRSIADRVAARFPSAFADSSAALKRVTEVVRRYVD